MLDEGWFHIGQLNTLPCVCFLFLELRKVKRSFKIEDKRLNKIGQYVLYSPSHGLQDQRNAVLLMGNIKALKRFEMKYNVPF